MPPAKPLTQNIFHGRNHSRPKARLDNGRRSCQFDDGCIQKHHADGIAANGPRSRSRSGSPLSLFLKGLHDDNEIVHAFGVDDVGRLFPADVQKTTVSDDWLQLGAVVKRSFRRLVIHLPLSCPWVSTWRTIAAAVAEQLCTLSLFEPGNKYRHDGSGVRVIAGEIA